MELYFLNYLSHIVGIIIKWVQSLLEFHYVHFIFFHFEILTPTQKLFIVYNSLNLFEDWSNESVVGETFLCFVINSNLWFSNHRAEGRIIINWRLVWLDRYFLLMGQAVKKRFLLCIDFALADDFQRFRDKCSKNISVLGFNHKH